MTWMVPSLLAILTGSAILSVVFWYLAIKEREAWLRLWALAWVVYTIRFAVDLLGASILADSGWTSPVSGILMIGTGVLLLGGAYDMQRARMPRWQLHVALVASVWTAVAAVAGLPALVAITPAWVYRGLTGIAAGVVLFRGSARSDTWGRVTGVSLVVWGVHILDYPILRGVAWFAPIGFLLGAAFEFVIAFGALITHFERTRDRLARSEQRYASMFEGSSSIGLLVDPDTAQIVDANDAAAAFYGRSRDELRAMLISDINTLTLAEIQAEMADARARHRNHFLFRHRRSNGLVADVEVYSGPITIEGRELLYSIVHDVSDRVAAERALRESETRYTNLFRRSRSAMVVVDPEGARIVDANHAAEDLYGWTAEELVTMSIADLTRDPQAHIDSEVAAAMAQQTHVESYTHRRKDGSEVAVEVYATPIVFEGRTLLYTIVNDVSERVETQRTLEEYRTHLERLVEERTRELTEANQALEDATRAKDEFMTSMSHELRTPLNSVIGFAEMLLRELPGPINDEQRRQIDMIGRSGHHLLAIVDDILDLARIEAGSVEVHRGPVDVRALVERLVEGVGPLAEKGSVTLASDVDDTIALETDGRLLEQILWNLVGNAIKFTPGGTVTVRASASAEVVTFSVADDGRGMTPEQLTHAFEKFTRFASVEGDGSGTGLGLSISSRLAEFLGGTLGARSVFGEGSCFTLRLPVAYTPPDHAVDN